MCESATTGYPDDKCEAPTTPGDRTLGAQHPDRSHRDSRGFGHRRRDPSRSSYSSITTFRSNSADRRGIFCYRLAERLRPGADFLVLRGGGF
jgi:hypothetical protein